MGGAKQYYQYFSLFALMLLTVFPLTCRYGNRYLRKQPERQPVQHPPSFLPSLPRRAHNTRMVACLPLMVKVKTLYT